MKRVLGLAVALLMGLGAATASAVNCEQVRRYLQTGRSAQEIAESMVIDINEVKKCQEQAVPKEAAPTPPTPKGQQ
jgi:hypothetical protein